MAAGPLYRKWFRQDWQAGLPTEGRLTPDPVTVAFPPDTGRVVIERVRLGVQAFGFNAAEDFYPSPVNPTRGLHAYVACARAETGSFPPPFNWPDIEDSLAHPESRPVLHGMLKSDYVATIANSDPLAGPIGVTWGASLTMEEADSHAQRGFNGTYLATAWLCVSNLSVGGAGPSYLPGFQAMMFLDVLAAGYSF